MRAKGRKPRVNVKTAMYDLVASHQRRVLGPPGDPKTHVPKMLANLKSRSLNTLPVFLADIRGKWPPEEIDEFEAHKPEFVLSNPELVSLLFDFVTQFDVQNEATDLAIMKAFDAAGLNYKNPIDWRILLRAFCWAHFGEKGKPGKLIEWTDKKYCELLRDVHQIKKEYAISMDAPALRKLLNVKGRKYNFISPVRLKKALGEARNLHYNRKLIKVVYDTATAAVDARMKAKQPSLTKSESNALLKRLSRQEADRIGSMPAHKQS